MVTPLPAPLLVHALNARLAYETYAAFAETLAARVIRLETELAEAQAWVDERALPVWRRETARRRVALYRARRVALLRAMRAVHARDELAQAIDAVGDAARRYVQELAAAREAAADLRNGTVPVSW